MPRSYPDWSNVRKEVSYILREDLAELAARLGSIDVYDRRGNVIVLESFRHGVGAFLTTTYGTGAAVALSTTYPKWPPFCVKVTAGSDGSRAAGLTKYIAPHPLGILGLEIHVALFTNFDNLTVVVDQYTGTDLYRAGIQLNDVADKIYYYDSSYNLEELADLPSVISDYGLYHSLKLVADMDNQLYKRFLFNQTDHDLSAYAINATADTSQPHVLVGIDLKGRAGSNDYCHLGGVIVTQDEN